MKLDRMTLQYIRIAAFAAKEEVVNEAWRDAYLQLGVAADRLDAMEARTEEVLTPQGE